MSSPGIFGKRVRTAGQFFGSAPLFVAPKKIEYICRMDLKYLVREPANITPETQLLILLHGYGSNEEDLFSFVPTLPEDWIIVSFRAPRTTEYGGYSWYDIDLMNVENRIDVPQAQESLAAILESILTITNNYGLTENETHLAGFSQGGILAYALALNNPELFSKIACMSCYTEDKLLENIVKEKKKLERLRFFVSHGTDDAVIPLEWGRKAAELLYDLSCYFSFREYMSGHGVNQKNYMDLMDFFKK
ncbi:phospholipase/carboxylesterase [Chryseobacterium sp. MP_3.2]|nr:phospholipase/carboxylesterase [Chryseobacterium sp. MP_3.2]